MYLHFSIQDVEQKELFFKLSNALSLADSFPSDKGKHAGIYSISKKGIVVYVGYSQNLASRLATHIRGKYSGETKILLFSPLDHGFSDFYSRNTISRKAILENNEKELMAALKPTENINIDMDFKLDEAGSMGMADIIAEIEEFEEDYGGKHNAIFSELASIGIEISNSGSMNIFDSLHLDNDSAVTQYMIDESIAYYLYSRGEK